MPPRTNSANIPVAELPRRSLDTIWMKPQSIRMPRRAATVKKTYNLPPELIARAKQILQARTETEAIVRSLEGVAYEDEIHRAVKRIGGRLPEYRRVR